MKRREGGDRLVFDNGRGGTGRTFDWRMIEDHPHLGNALVAGGVGADNAGEAMGLGAYAIDVGSRLESAPGIKSADKIRRLFDALRPSCRQELRACA
jgi:indole-3-glycerol phosphate synthase/phosphoribosylanthranilate isomerase